MSAPAARREAVGVAIERHGLSERHACRLVGLNRAGYRTPPRPDRNAWLRIRLKEFAEARTRFGAPRLYVLLRREGHVINHKRVTRIYQQEGLSLRRKRRKKRISHLRVVRPAPTQVNQRWSMDFVMDSLWNGRRFRALTIVDDLSRESPAIEVDRSLSGLRVSRVLDRLADERGLPEVITVDNGPEFQSRALDQWAYDHGVHLQFIRPGKPVENAYIESFNGRFREECLNEMVFMNLADARTKIERWRQDYNTRRPHSSLDGMTPAEFAQHHRVMQNSAGTNLSLVHRTG